MTGILTKVWADLRRRRAQGVVVLALSLLAALVATLSTTLLTRASAPFDEAFEAARGAHAIIRLDGRTVTMDQLAATASLPGVTAAGPPHPIAFVPFDLRGRKVVIDVVGRDDPGGALDRIVLVAGRWAVAPGEIVVRRVAVAQDWEVRAVLGDHLRPLSRPGAADLEVVGEAIDLSDSGFPSARAWVPVDTLGVLTNDGQSRPGYEMAYRFDRATTVEDVQAGLAAIRRALPGAADLSEPATWFASRMRAAWIVGLMGAVLAGSTAFALLAVALIVANAVAGAVVANRREIAVMKAVGFTPRGVAAVFVLQMLGPTLVGGLVGVLFGIVASRPLLDAAGESMALPVPDPISPPTDVGVLLGLLLIVAIASAVPAVGAGRLRSVPTLRLGAPAPASLSAVARALQRLPLPLTLRLGAGLAFARSTRALLTLSAMCIAVVTMTTAAALNETVSSAIGDRSLYELSQDVTIDRFGQYPDPKVVASLNDDPETLAVIAIQTGSFLADGAATSMKAVAVRGESQALGYHTIRGRWFAAPGEAVMTSAALNHLGLELGDSVSGLLDGAKVRLTVVGTIVDVSSTDGMVVRTGWATYQDGHPGAEPSRYLVRLRAGADPAAYAGRVEASQSQSLDARATDLASVTGTSTTLVAMMAALVLILLLIAVAGVFNTMLLTVREKAFDNAVLKALGMTPRQVLAMVAAASSLLAVAAVAIGVPVGLGLSRLVLQAMADYAGATGVFMGGGLGLPSLVVIVAMATAAALAGAAVPARVAIRERPAPMMRAE